MIYERKRKSDLDSIGYKVNAGRNIREKYDNGRTIFEVNYEDEELDFYNIKSFFAENEINPQEIAYLQSLIVSKSVFRLIKQLRSLNMKETEISFDFSAFFQQENFLHTVRRKELSNWIDDCYKQLLYYSDSHQLHLELEVFEVFQLFRK